MVTKKQNFKFIFSGSCDELKLKAKLIGGNPGRLTFKWTAALAEGESELDEQMKAAMGKLTTYLKNLSPSADEVKLTSVQTPFIGKKIKFVVRVQNFLKNFKEGSITVARINKELPQAQLDRKEMTVFVSKEIRVKGMMFHLYVGR